MQFIRRKNQQYALNVPLLYFYVLAPTCSGSSLPSSGSLLDPPELREIQTEGWYIIQRVVTWPVCRIVMMEPRQSLMMAG
jgi:hypothetical protein